MAMKKGGGLLAILGAGPGKGGEGAEDEAMDAKVSAMRDMREAMQGGDDEAAAAAFKRAYDACMMGHESAEGPEAEPPEYDE